MTAPLQMRWMAAPAMVDPVVRRQLLECWRDVTNAGGAVGFPFPPVSDEQVRSSLDAMVQSLDESANRLLLASINGELAGWLFLAGNSSELTAHWARVLRVQTALGFRKRGVGACTHGRGSRAATEDLALDQLHLELRSGMGLEDFYRSCGWQEIGRWPGALRLPEGDQDEVLMTLPLS